MYLIIIVLMWSRFYYAALNKDPSLTYMPLYFGICNQGNQDEEQ